MQSAVSVGLRKAQDVGVHRNNPAYLSQGIDNEPNRSSKNAATQVRLATPETDVPSKGRSALHFSSPPPLSVSEGTWLLCPWFLALSKGKKTRLTMTIGPLSPTRPPLILPSFENFHSSIEKLRTNASLYSHHEEKTRRSRGASQCELGLKRGISIQHGAGSDARVVVGLKSSYWQSEREWGWEW